MNNARLWLAVAVIALLTALLRLLPFLIFRGGKTPKWITRLAHTLPPAVMGMLVVYCLRTVSFAALAGWLPALISCLVVVLLHLWQRKTLFSILGGTVTYMLLVQLVF